MKKNVLFALIALFCVSSSAWAQYVKLTAADGTVSWIEIKGKVDGTNIELYDGDYVDVIDRYTSGAIDLRDVWSESGESGTHYKVTGIGLGAFYRCGGLTSITLPIGVTSIGRSAFEYCSALTSINIPNSVTSIGPRAFFRCKSLTSIEIPSSMTSIEAYTFAYCENLTSVVIPNSVTSIGESAFYSCGNLTSVVIPYSVTSIGDESFAYCSYLTSLEIPSSVTSIGSGAFQSCSNLTTAVIPSSVTSIGKRAFYNNFDLLSIFSYITDVFVTGEEAFSDCEKATLYVPRGTVEAYKLTADWNSISKIEEKPQAFVVSCNDKGKVRMTNVGVQFTNNVVDVIINDGTDNLFYFEPNDNCVLKQVLIDGVDVTRSVRYNELKATVHQGSKMIVIFDEPSYDVNGDGTVNITDVVNLVNFILGQ